MRHPSTLLSLFVFSFTSATSFGAVLNGNIINGNGNNPSVTLNGTLYSVTASPLTYRNND